MSGTTNQVPQKMFWCLFSIPLYLTFVGFRIDVSGCLNLLLVIDESLLEGEKEEVQGSATVLWFISLNVQHLRVKICWEVLLYDWMITRF